MKTALNPYLNFNGNSREAMEFYKAIFGGELTISTFGESGMNDEKYKDQTMHAHLHTDEMEIMASDTGHMGEVKFGDNVHLSIVGSDVEKLTEYFNKLAEGGKVDMPLEKQMWGDIFGMLTDKYGVHWMVNISQGEQK